MRSKRSVCVSLVLLAALLALSSSLLAAVDPQLVGAVKQSDIKAVRALLQAKVDVNSASADGTTALHWAVDGGAVDIAKALIAAGANVKATNHYGITPLRIACLNADAAMVELLLKAGADANTVFSDGEPAIMTAARTGNAQIVKLLVAAGADVNAKEPKKNQTAMMWATMEGHAEVVKVLIELGADVNAKGQGGYDAMMYATREGYTDIVKTLLDAGVDVNTKTPEDMTLLNLAILNAHYDTGALLVNRGADVSIVDQRQGTALANVMKLRRMGGCGTFDGPKCPKLRDVPASMELAQLLLEKGADVNASVPAGRGGGAGGAGFAAQEIAASIGALKAEKAIQADPKASSDFYKYAGLFTNGDGDGQGGGQGNFAGFSAATQAAIAAAAASNVGVDQDPAAAAAAAVPRGRGAQKGGISLIQLALGQSDLEMFKLLLAKGANPLAPLPKGVTPLMLAAGPAITNGRDIITIESERENHEAFELVKLVYSLGSTDVNAVDEVGATALFAAAKRGSKEIIQFLVDRGAKLDVETTFGWTALDVARGYRDFLGVGRRQMKTGAITEDTAAFIEKLMKERGLPTEHYPSGAPK
jgi:ankyrin repeat protein